MSCRHSEEAMKAGDGMSRSGDGIVLPKDADGRTIRPGDTVLVKETGAKMRVNRMYLDTALNWSIFIGRHDKGWDKGVLVAAKALTKNKPDTWEDLIADMRGLLDNWDLLDDPRAEVEDNIERIQRLAGAVQ